MSLSYQFSRSSIRIACYNGEFLENYVINFLHSFMNKSRNNRGESTKTSDQSLLLSQRNREQANASVRNSNNLLTRHTINTSISNCKFINCLEKGQYLIEGYVVKRGPTCCGQAGLQSPHYLPGHIRTLIPNSKENIFGEF